MATCRSTKFKAEADSDRNDVLLESSAMSAPGLHDNMSDQYEYETNDGDVRPGRKKQKATMADDAGATANSSIQLKMLSETPIDVLFEIFSHLHPVDVLHLTWTSKDFHDLLMRRSAISVWRGAFESAPGIPECPADQTLPQWARLSFVPHCHLCLAPGNEIMFALRMRACQRCVSSKRDIFATFQDLRKAVSLSPPLSAEVAAEDFPCKWARHESYGMRRVQRKDRLYLRADMETTLASCEEALKNGTDALRKFLAEKIAYLEKYMASCEKLSRLERVRRDKELLDLQRAQRRKDIIWRLKELGYGADVNYITTHCAKAFDWHGSVRTSQKLTDKAWANIEQPMVDFVLRYRPARLKAERRDRMAKWGALLKEVLADYRNRASSPSGARILPDGDIAASSSFSWWRDVDLDDVEPNAAVFTRSLAEIPALFAPWWRAVEDVLLQCLGPAAVDPGVLARATTWFCCGGCKRALLREQVAEHECFTCPAYDGMTQLVFEHAVPDTVAHDERELLFFNALGSVPWNSKDAKGRVCMPVGYAQETLSLCAEALVKMCGMNPAQATAADMDAAGVMFTCTRYGPNVVPNVKLVDGCGESMSWSDAVRHHYMCHGYHEKGPSFEFVREI